jgi:hypothetical protein
MENNVFILGTCRLHRLFTRHNKGEITNNTNKEVIVHYPKIGFVHTLGEINQTIDWIDKKRIIPGYLGKYIFRKENPTTTPNNEFSAMLEGEIISEKDLTPPPINFKNIENFIFEICSLKAHYHSQSGLYLHANPNFPGEIPYKDIPGDGIFSAKGFNVDGVEGVHLSLFQMEELFTRLLDTIPANKLHVMGHLIDPENPNAVRKEVNDILSKAAQFFGFNYIDTGPFIKKYGFNNIDGKIDIHHLSMDGEIEFGKYIQQIIRRK